MIVVINLLTAVCALAVLWSLLCRVNLLQRGVTEPLVFWQHLALASGVLAALLLPPPWGRLGLVAGLLFYLLAGANRWRNGAPAGVKLQRESES